MNTRSDWITLVQIALVGVWALVFTGFWIAVFAAIIKHLLSQLQSM